VLPDLVGYTRLTDERGDQAAADLAAALALLVDGSAREHGGRPVKWLGDGVMVYFREPAGAVLLRIARGDRADFHRHHRGCKRFDISGPVASQSRPVPRWRLRPPTTAAATAASPSPLPPTGNRAE
jgi:class 3 adenylate cyclase